MKKKFDVYIWDSLVAVIEADSSKEALAHVKKQMTVVRHAEPQWCNRCAGRRRAH
jgi:hypothetical protein